MKIPRSISRQDQGKLMRNLRQATTIPTRRSSEHWGGDEDLQRRFGRAELGDRGRELGQHGVDCTENRAGIGSCSDDARNRLDNATSNLLGYVLQGLTQGRTSMTIDDLRGLHQRPRGPIHNGHVASDVVIADDGDQLGRRHDGVPGGDVKDN